MQCSFDQSSIDCLGAVYYGSVDEKAIFKPELLSGVVMQIKNQEAPQNKAEIKMRPIGIPRDLERPLPYLAILMELGTAVVHQATGSNIKCTTSDTPPDQFRNLTRDWINAANRLNDYLNQRNPEDNEVRKQRKNIDAKRQAMDFCNRYTISVRGASPCSYGILNEAKIALEFKNLLSITVPSPTLQDETLQHMRPLEHLGECSSHTRWMLDCVSDNTDSYDNFI